MTDTSGPIDYKQKCQQLEKALEIYRRDYELQKKVLEVLVAVGHVSREKAEQARDIVSQFCS